MGKHTPRLVVILSTITIEVHNEINHNPSPNEGGMLCLGIKRMTMFWWTETFLVDDGMLRLCQTSLNMICLSIVGVVNTDLLHCCYRFRMYLCFRLEAPHYRRVSPVSGRPQKLIITKEVGGTIHNFWWKTNSFWHEANISLVYKSNKSMFYFGNTVGLFCFFFRADCSSATPCCGSSVEEHHLHPGALWQLHWAAGKTPPKHLQVRPDETLSIDVKQSFTFCQSMPFESKHKKSGYYQLCKVLV